MVFLPFSRVGFLEKLLFTKHLAIMIRSGIILSEALETLVDQTKSRVFRDVLSRVLSDVENGQSFATALSKHRNIFDQFFISLIEVGEESGTLEQNLDFLSRQLGKEYVMRKKVQGAMLYPGLVFFSVTVMGGFMSLFILPQLVDFFSAFQIELPLSTKILLFVATVMKQYGIALLSLFLSLVFLFFLLIQMRVIKPIWHAFLLSLPVVGPFLSHVNLARLCRNLGILIQSGIPMLRCLETTAHTLDNVLFQRVLLYSREEVKKGKQLAKAFSDTSLVPPLVTKMVSVGEKTGKMEEVLLYLGDFYEEEVDEFSKNLSTILEPILLIGIGIVVGFVAIAIISPIYELTGSFR